MLKDSIVKIKRSYNTYTPINELWGAGDSQLGGLDSNIILYQFSNIETNGAISMLTVSDFSTFYIKTDGTLWGFGANYYGDIGNNSSSAVTEFTQIGNSNNWSKISAGYGSTLGIRTDGSLWGWGFNSYGQIGDGTMSSKSSPVQIGTLKDWETVLSSSYYSLAVKKNGTLWSWGDNTYGQLGNEESQFSLIPVNNTDEWSKIGAGNDFSIAIKTNGTLWGWGMNIYGTIGDGTYTNRSSPIQIGTLSNWSKLSVAGFNSASIKTDGTLWMWGTNSSFGGLGNNSTQTQLSPVQIGTLSNWSDVSVGYYHTMAIKTDGSLWGWGYNIQGQLGDMESNYSLVEIKDPSTIWDKVSSGSSHTIAIKTDGTLWGWGVNGNGQVGDNSATNRPSPVQIGTRTGWLNVFAGNSSSFAIRTDGTLWSWGSNAGYELGINDYSSNKSSPVQVGTLTNWSFVYSNDSNTMAIKTDGTLWGWGDNYYGKIGDLQPFSAKVSPVQVGTPHSWSSVTTAENLTMAIRNDGTLWAWGYNTSGAFGNNTSSLYQSSPIQIGTLSNWYKVSRAKSYTMAIKTDGTLWGWGLNNVGQLGTYQIFRNIISDISEHSSGNYFTIAIKNNGTLWSWGSNSNYGELGIEDRVDRSSPTQVGTLANWLKVSAGASHTLAIKNDGTLWSWGYGGAGQLGTGGYSTLYSPTRIGTETNWSSVRGMEHDSLAIKNDGTLWGWGTGYNGSLLGYSTASPVQINNSNDWSKIYGQRTIFPAVLAIKTNGTLWGWGNNTYGLIGDNTTITKSSPVQIGTLSDWSDVVIRNNVAIALKSDNTIWTWGSGLLGDSYSEIGRSSPIQIADGYNKIGNSLNANYLVKTDGTLWGWGYNNNYDLSSELLGTVYVPTQIDSRTNWESMGGGLGFGMIKNTSDELFSFGNNTTQLGDIGLYNNISRSSPIQIGRDANWLDISNGSSHTIAIKSNGTLFGWGGSGGLFGLSGDISAKSSPVQLSNRTDWEIISANNSRNAALAKNNPNRDIYVFGNSSFYGWDSNKSSPVQIGTLTDWSKVSAGYVHTTAIKTDGTLWSWGYNQQGSLGTGRFLNSLVDSPIQIGGLNDWSKVNVSYYTSMSIKTDGTLWAWGANNTGQLGDGTVNSKTSPIQIGTETNWYKISLGGDNSGYTISIKTDGTLWSWGYNASGQLGLGNLINRSSPIQVGKKTNWIEISASIDSKHTLALNSDNKIYATGAFQSPVVLGNVLNKMSPVQIGTLTNWSKVYSSLNTSIAIKTDGTLWSWGLNNSGTMGVGDFKNYDSPVQVGDETTWEKIATSMTHSMGIKTDNTLWGWGANGGRLGLEYDTTTYNIGFYPYGWEQFAASYFYTMAIKTDGTLWGWGNAQYGALGDGSTNQRNSPVKIGTLNNWSKIFVSPDSSFPVTMAIKTDGTLWTWGANSYGGLGLNLPSNQDRSSPVQVGTLSNWSTLSVAFNGALALKTDGTLWAWGRDEQGRLGQGTIYNDKSSPTQVGTLSNWSKISFSYYRSFAIKTDGSLWGWGLNTSGELGDNTIINKYSPIQIATDSTWLEVATGGANTIAIKSNGSLWAWGSVNSGMLGNGESPFNLIKVNPSTSWSKISASNSADNSIHMMGIRVDGTLWGWGMNNNGQLGDNTTNNKNSPLQIGTLSNWAQISSGNSFTMAIKTDGTLWGWGVNNNYDLGDGTTTNKSSPVQIGTFTDWSKVSAGASYGMAIKTDGTLWGWGYNYYGRIGSGGWFNYLISPVQVGTDTNWSNVTSGHEHTLAIKTNGTLWAWGYSGDGALGNTSSFYSSPVQVGTLSNWSKVEASYSYTMAIKTDGTLWGWGNNSAGQLGLNNTNNYQSPMQIGNDTNWSIIKLSRSSSMAIKTDGTLWGWGSNSSGQLAELSSINRSSPVQIGTKTNWRDGDISNITSGVIDSINELYTSGTPGYSGSTSNKSSPVQIGTLTNWLKVYNGGTFGIALSQDGTLWGWGTNSEGVFGNGTNGNVYTYPIQILPELTLNGKISISNITGAFQTNLNELYFTGNNSSYQRAGVWNQTFPSPLKIGKTSDWSDVSVGNSYTIAVRTNGTLWGWGLNNVGQLGETGSITRSSPIQIGNLTNWSNVEAKYSNSMALDSSGKLYSTSYGVTYGKSIPIQVTSSSNWNDISVGNNHAIGIKTDGTIWGWGSNSSGQLGVNSIISYASPIQLGTHSNWLKVSAGENFTMAIKTNGTLWGWGNNNYGKIGDTTQVGKSSPVQIGTLSNWSSVSAGLSHTMAIKTDGTLWGWGVNNNYELGDGTATNKSSPVQIGTFTDWSKVSTGYYYNMAVRNNGTLWGWGYDIDGKIGNNTNYSYYFSPVQIGTLSDWLNVSANFSTTFAIKTDKTLWGWGRNSDGQIPITVSQSNPNYVATNNLYSKITGGVYYNIAIATNGTLWGWGLNSNGQLGLSDTVSRISPVQIGTLANWASISSGDSYTMAIKTDGTLWGWGGASFGEIGDGSSGSKSSPVQIGALNNWLQVSTGDNHVLSIKKDGTLWVWGSNDSGQLGLNLATNAHRSSPIQLGVQNDWVKVSAGLNHSLGIRADGSLWSWGGNTFGGIGTNNTTSFSSPVQIGTLRDWIDVFAGGYSSMAIKNDRTLWGWGLNNFGQLGDSTTIIRSSPVQIGTLKNWLKIDCSKLNPSTNQNAYTMAIKTDGTLWGWGMNTSGEIGDGTIINRSSPVQIGTRTNWSQVSANRDHTGFLDSMGYIYTAGSVNNQQNGYDIGYKVSRSSPIQIGKFGEWVTVDGSSTTDIFYAVKTDGTLWSWGTNTTGVLGDGTNINRSSPVQVGNYSYWTNALAGSTFFIGKINY
jgi:alpha-tubulin suppressor-like RCC1 family protein